MKHSSVYVEQSGTDYLLGHTVDSFELNKHSLIYALYYKSSSMAI